MNPRDRRLRLRRSTIRDLTPSKAAHVQGGAKYLATKTQSEEACPEPTGGCTATCGTACHTDCGGGGFTCITCGEYSCDDTCTCAGSCQGGCESAETVCTCYEPSCLTVCP